MSQFTRDGVADSLSRHARAAPRWALLTRREHCQSQAIPRA
jgi:hypothetical protein